MASSVLAVFRDPSYLFDALGTPLALKQGQAAGIRVNIPEALIFRDVRFPARLPAGRAP